MLSDLHLVLRLMLANVFLKVIFFIKNCDVIVFNEHYIKIKSLNTFFKNSHVVFIDITNIICPSGICKMNIGYSNATYLDNTYLSISCSELVLNKIITNFRN